MVLKWTRTKPEPLKYFEQELNLNPNRYLKRFDTLLKTDVFFRWKLGEDQKKRKKKVFAETWSVFLLNRYFRGIWCCIRRDFVGLFPLINQLSNLDGGRLNLDKGTLKLDGGTRPPPPSPPYNLNTGYNHGWAS